MDKLRDHPANAILRIALLLEPDFRCGSRGDSRAASSGRVLLKESRETGPRSDGHLVGILSALRWFAEAPGERFCCRSYRAESSCGERWVYCEARSEERRVGKECGVRKEA